MTTEIPKDVVVMNRSMIDESDFGIKIKDHIIEYLNQVPHYIRIKEHNGIPPYTPYCFNNWSVTCRNFYLLSGEFDRLTYIIVFNNTTDALTFKLTHG